MREVGIVALLLGVTLVLAIADGDSGLRLWNRLRADLAAADARVGRLVRENEALQGQLAALEDDPLALEGAIREDLELARPGETVVRFSVEQSNHPISLTKSR